MRKTVYKWFWGWSFDKEDAWLNEMATKGLALVSVGFCKYTFEECLPGKCKVRLELLDNPPTHPESQAYIRFIEETGAEYLGSITRWVYFRNTTGNGEFNLFSDISSRIKHLDRILPLFMVICIVNIFIGFSNTMVYVQNGIHVSLSLGILNLILGLTMVYGALRIVFKRYRLKKEQQLFE